MLLGGVTTRLFDSVEVILVGDPIHEAFRRIAALERGAQPLLIGAIVEVDSVPGLQQFFHSRFEFLETDFRKTPPPQ